MSAELGEGRGPDRKKRPRRRVRKRDGRIVPYEPERVRAAVRKAQSAVGEEDPLFATEVEEVVSLALGVRFASSWNAAPETGGADLPVYPGIEEIQDLVEDALVEMGSAPVAKVYIRYRDRRSRRREALRVHSSAQSDGPRVLHAEGTSPWNKGRIVASLIDEAELPREVAEEVATRVEERVIDGGWRRLSTALVRELAENELASMGYAEALRRQEAVRLPRHDLRRLLAEGMAGAAFNAGGPGNDPLIARSPIAPEYAQPMRSIEDRLAGEVLRRYSAGDLLDGAPAELHRSGELHFEDMEHPHLPLVRSLPATLLLRGEPNASSAFELITELAPLVRGTAFGVTLENVGRVLRPLVNARGRVGRSEGARRSSVEVLSNWLRALGALGLATGRSIDLSSLGSRSSSLLAQLIQARAQLARSGATAPRLFLSWDELAPALEADSHAAPAAEELLALGHLVPVWHGASERWTAPGCRRRPKEQSALACMGAVCINLPRLARRAGPWREDALFEGLVASLEVALDGLAQLQRFHEEHRGGRAYGLRERGGYALTPVGLAEALRILGDGEVRVDQGARLLGLMAEATRRFAERRAMTVVLSSLFGARARSRFASLDANARRTNQARLFEGLPAPEDDHTVSYAPGFLLPSGTARSAAWVHEGAAWVQDAEDSALPGAFAGAGAHGPARFADLYASLLATVGSGALAGAQASPFDGLHGSGGTALGELAGSLRSPASTEECPQLAAWESFDKGRAPAAAPAGSSAATNSGAAGQPHSTDHTLASEAISFSSSEAQQHAKHRSFVLENLLTRRREDLLRQNQPGSPGPLFEVRSARPLPGAEHQLEQLTSPEESPSSDSDSTAGLPAGEARFD